MFCAWQCVAKSGLWYALFGAVERERERETERERERERECEREREREREREHFVLCLCSLCLSKSIYPSSSFNCTCLSVVSICISVYPALSILYVCVQPFLFEISAMIFVLKKKMTILSQLSLLCICNLSKHTTNLHLELSLQICVSFDAQLLQLVTRRGHEGRKQ